MPPEQRAPAARRHLLWSLGVATALVVAAVAVPGVASGRTGDLWDATQVSTSSTSGERSTGGERSTTGEPAAGPAAGADDGHDHDHDHSDPATKNSLSRAGGISAATRDPSTAAQRLAAADYVESERALPDPELTKLNHERPHAAFPQDVHAMAGGCYTMRSGSRYLTLTADDVPRLAAVPRASAARLYFKASDLAQYLIHGPKSTFLTGGANATMSRTPTLARSAWNARKVLGGYTFANPDGRPLTARSDGTLGLGTAPPTFTLQLTDGCTAMPEADVNVSGLPHAGVSEFQEVRGYADAHVHGMAYEFLGGRVHCGRPWHPLGVALALTDCPDHTLTQGKGAIMESFLSGEASHDPVGWPTFKDWPAPNSLTHEGTYYRWLERAWRGGQRIFVNLLVENNKLCQIYPLKKNSCDDMDSVRLQAQRMREMERYIDAQYGGPGRGFYRIVTNPFQARRVINQGRLAVVMGMETSIPFGCTYKRVLGNDGTVCTQARIDAGLDELHRLGVRQVELVNKFDNALAGVAGDAGQVGVMVNATNFLETASFWAMKHCEPADGESADKTQLTSIPIDAEQQDALFGAIGSLFGVLPAVPVYGPPLHCNARGLTELGDYAVRGLAKRNMVFDPDHLSVKARNASLDLIEQLEYPGVISSHSWSTPDAYPRVYKAGGFITPYAGDSTGFVEKWRRHLGWADPRYYFGFGFGSDINGLGAQGDPRGADVPNPVTYPFTGFDGVTIDKQVAGQRVWDINSDGVAQYGLYPDWIEDLTHVAGSDGAALADDMARGAEAYLQMWERANGIAPDPCRNPQLRKDVADVRRLVTVGLTTDGVMRRLGQPYQRLGTTYTYCALDGGSEVRAEVAFSPAGRVTGLTVVP